MNALLQIPEIQALRRDSALIRIPHQIDVPVTDRVMRLIDTVPFQRLKQISQLGVVSFVYPGAHHDRFEHSLGVYRNALLVLEHFATQPGFAEIVEVADAESLLLAALLHDIGHWPFCHPIEDLRLDGIPKHETLAAEYLLNGPIGDCLRTDWGKTPDEVLAVLTGEGDRPASPVLSSILSGPIDIDKLDYLYRDSLHAGVPYGQNFDMPRLIRSLCLNEAGDSLAITHKGRTAAELMVVARYVMFSEVYWHRAVRSATAMFQRAFFDWHAANREADDPTARMRELFRGTERTFLSQMQTDLAQSANPSNAGRQLLHCLFGPRRQLHKCVATYDMNDHPEIYTRVAQQPYAWLVQTGQRLISELQGLIDGPIQPWEVLIDAPPIGLEVQFDVDVFYSQPENYRRLGEVSPLVQALARHQFDDFVKQVRIFVSADVRQSLKRVGLDHPGAIESPLKSAADM